MNNIELKILGTQSPYCLENGAGPSYYIKYNNTKILLDCGSGSHRFFNFDEMENLNIIISHLHKDHFSDLSNYLYASYCLKNLNLLNNPITIYTPTYPTEPYNIIKNEPLCYAEFKDINTYSQYKIDNVMVDFCKVEHDKYIENYAIKLTIENKIIVYTGDISFSAKDTIINFAKNADILICDSSFIKAHNKPEVCNHLSAYQAGLIAKETNVKKLILTHLWPKEDINKYLNEAKNVFSNTFVAKEKDTYTI